ncbi:helix-turn-helix domain-containing protein [Brevibacillus humidisoli]|uniref:helix-turn-helix domain-containing protein n=1 Tax=Brevibacillus humidisoli TaxID=2895522 RepID=UPI001E58BF75|nr:helix-turn-helix transcriptional regulator [Brevibacillus humidisoli]UFJ41414.1 helix-turn-helix domain-containing protein [Brevibacillus humidisoli]
MTFGTRLKHLRHQLGLSQQDLANRIGLNRSTYARYETDDNQADYETLQKLADFFGTSIDYLLGRTDQSKPEPSSGKETNPSHPAAGDLQAFISERHVLYFGEEQLELSEEEQAELLRHMRLAWMIIKEKRQEQEQELQQEPQQKSRAKKRRNRQS